MDNKTAYFSKQSDITAWAKNNYPTQFIWDSEIDGLHLKRNAKSVSWILSYRNEAGKQRFPTIGRFPAITLTQARLKAKDILANAMNGIDYVQQKQQTKAERLNTAQNYLDEIYRHKLSKQATGHETMLYFDRYFTEWMDKPMGELTAKDVTKWQAKMIKNEKAFATMVRALGVFKALLNDAVKKGYLTANPIDKAQLDRIAESTEDALARQKKRRALTTEEMKQVFAGVERYQEKKRLERRNSRLHGKGHLPDLDAIEFVDHVKPITLFAFYTGFRPSDIFSLHWEHVNINPFGSNIHKVIEKTKHKVPEPRTFPISQKVVDLLQAWRSQQGNPKTGLVFPSPVTGNQLGKKAMQTPWKHIRSLGGLPDELDFYSLRHNFISQLVAQGHDLMSIAALAGHSDIKMLIDHYGHLQPNNLKTIIAESFAHLLDDSTTLEATDKSDSL
jgi:integrase